MEMVALIKTLDGDHIDIIMTMALMIMIPKVVMTASGNIDFDDYYYNSEIILTRLLFFISIVTVIITDTDYY